MADSPPLFADFPVRRLSPFLTIKIEAETMESKKLISRKTDWAGIAVPIVLMITGLILLGGDYLGVLSLDRIQNLWPLALIMIGFVGLSPESDTNRN